MKNELLEYSFQNQLAHIPSALSMLDYLDVLFTEGIVTLDHGFVIGKPFGAQAYYLIWRKMGWLDNIEKLSMGVKHEEIPFVNFSEETMGNALGVATGIAMTTNERIWVNISDAALQMGNTLEAIQFISQHKIDNIFVTIDYNGSQVTGSTKDIIDVDPVKNLFTRNWFVQEVDGHIPKNLSAVFHNLDPDRPNVVFCNTRKGNGIPQMENNPKEWHYRKISSEQELEMLIG